MCHQCMSDIFYCSVYLCPYTISKLEHMLTEHKRHTHSTHIEVFIVNQAANQQHNMVSKCGIDFFVYHSQTRAAPNGLQKPPPTKQKTKHILISLKNGTVKAFLELNGEFSCSNHVIHHMIRAQNFQFRDAGIPK